LYTQSAGLARAGKRPEPDAGPSLPYRGLRFLERRTHRSADHVISTNDSYRQIAIDRSGKDPADVTVVRTGPDPARLQRAEPDLAQRRGRQHLAAYIGVMGPQDGVDIVVRAAAVIVHEMGREDIAFVTRRLFRYRVHRIALADITGVEWRKGLLLNRLVLNTRGGARVFHTFKDVRVHKVTAPARQIAPAAAIAPVAVTAIPAKPPEIAISFSKRQAT